MNSFVQAVLHATIISKAVLVLLLLMSLSSWAFMCGKWFQLRKAYKAITTGLRLFDDAGKLKQSLSLLEASPSSPLYGITRRAVREFNRLADDGDGDRLLNDNLRRAMHFGIEEQMDQLRSSMSFLATTSNTAPFIGLFGTVWGIMHSFQAIASMKSVALATVAPGIAEALIATAVGLFVAIPATCGYNMFRAQAGRIERVCITFGGQLLNRLQQEAPSYKSGITFAEEEKQS